jgi:poly-beta-hydroxybutyrate-responsive repressor
VADVVSDSNTSNGDARSGRLGRDLLTPYILLLLSTYQMHGYVLLQRLTELGLGLFDPATVYRTLRAMERDGLIASHWDTASEGPARRVYGLTDAGSAMLDSWAGALDAYQRTLATFFDLYAHAGRATIDAMTGAARRTAADDGEGPANE